MERTIKRLWVLCLVLILCLVASNVYWVWYESQWEDVVTTESYESSVDGDGTAVTNGSGEVNYGGESEVHEDNKD